MKKKIAFLELILVLLFFFINNNVYAQEISREKAYLHMVKLMNWSPKNCALMYGFNFDKINYQKIKSDEFERNKYVLGTEKLIKSKIEKIDFSEKFTIKGAAKFGEYDFEKERFPITSWNWDEGWVIDSDGDLSLFFLFYITNAINLKDFNIVLNMKSAQASTFVKARKNMKGEINRDVFLKATYSIVNKEHEMSANKFYVQTYLYSIDIYSDQALTQKLSTIFPYREYYDKIKGIRLKDGIEIFYFKDREQGDWSSSAASVNKSGTLPSMQGAKYFRQVKYLNGKIINVNDYYNFEIFGKLEMSGSYDSFCIEPRCANGLFSWYWENGIKRQEANFVNGKMEGCVFMWDKDGKCRKKYSSYMTKGSFSYNSSEDKRCECIDIDKPSNTYFEMIKSSVDTNGVPLKLAKNTTIPFNYSPFLFKGTWRGSTNGVSIQLLNAEIKENTIDLNFTMQANEYHEEVLIYHPTLKKADGGWNRYEDVIPPYIQDDKGATFYSTGFLGGTQKAFNRNSNGIYLNANEKVTVTVTFPMISEGASRINFICPGESGHQSDWYWNNISLIKK